MASNLRVDSIVPSTSGNVSIGTATGGVTIPGNLGIAGVLTYEDVTNVDSVGVITARGGIKIGATGANTLIGGNATGIGIGIASPTSKLYVNGVSTNDIITARAADTNGTSVINILAEGTTGHSRIKFSDTAGTDGQISYTHTDRALTFAAGGTTEKVRISSEGYVTKPNNPAFRARSSSGGWKSFGNTNFNTMPFNAEDFDSGGNYNTSTYKFTVPVAGKYYFYCQMLHDGTTANGASSGKMQIYVGSDIVTFAKSGTQGEIVSCSTVWDCTVGEEVYCQGSTNTTNPDDWHGDSYYSYFTGYLIG